MHASSRDPSCASTTPRARLALAACALALLLRAASAQDEPAPPPAPPPEPPPAAAPIDARAIESAVERGIVLLLEQQEALGKDEREAAEWPYEGVYRVGGEIPLGYRVGGTAICALALLETTRKPLREPVEEALGRALEFVLDALGEPLMRPGFEGAYDVRGWGHAYALGFLLRMRTLERVPRAQQKAVDRAIAALVATLMDTEIGKRGGWNYSRPQGADSAASTFMTAPTLQFLFEAAAQGEKVDRKVIERALDGLEQARLDNGAFQYGANPERKTGKGFEAVPGAIGRMPVCEATLLLAGRGSVEHVRGALEQFFEHWEWLEKRRKQPGTHVAPYMIAPYYFFYAHRYAAQAIELLPADERDGWRQKLHVLLWKVRDADGSFNDRVFPRSANFGTAMSMLALVQPALPAPAGWKPR